MERRNWKSEEKRIKKSQRERPSFLQNAQKGWGTLKMFWVQPNEAYWWGTLRKHGSEDPPRQGTG
jgi:hypothetical protein